MDQFFLKTGYKCNLDGQGKAIPYIDDVEGAAVYQLKVYEYAKTVIRRYKLKNVLDIGCGYGIKLKEIIYKECKDLVGIDNDTAIKYCKKFHNFGKWYSDDIENSTLNIDRKFDLIISSDVIEHLVNPNKLIKYIEKYCHCNTHIILSTPDREKIAEQKSLGPPRNIYHVREWSELEFNHYLKKSGFHIKKHFHVSDRISGFKKLIKIFLGLEHQKIIQIVHCLKSENASIQR